MTSYINDLFALEGKVAIVSGASRGIGKEIAEALSKAGVQVFGVGRSKNIEDVSFEYVQLDASDASEFKYLCNNIYNKYGAIDIYIHAAGISLSKSEENIDNFVETINFNLNAAYQCCKTVSSFMISNKNGSIINITSIASVLGFPDNPGYVASKGGLRMLTKAMALDLGRSNVRVNNIAPGYIHTRMTTKSFNDPLAKEHRSRQTMLHRWGDVTDLVGAAIFLSSDASKYITGIDLFVDGGWTAKGI
jgi:gluconate 5-dehydrogenase